MLHACDMLSCTIRNYLIKWKVHNNRQIFHAFLFNIKNYSPDLSNINDVRRSWILSYRVWIISILNKNSHGIFVLLYTLSTKENLGWMLTRQSKFQWRNNFLFFLKMFELCDMKLITLKVFIKWWNSIQINYIVIMTS